MKNTLYRSRRTKFESELRLTPSSALQNVTSVNCMKHFVLLAGLVLSLLAVSCVRNQEIAASKGDAQDESEMSGAAKTDSANQKSGSKRKSPVKSLTIGTRAPSIDIEHWISDGQGKFKPITNFESGKVYVVEFWATWCGPCVASMPHLAETQTKYADHHVQIISISDEDTETIAKFLDREVGGAKHGKKEESEDEGKSDATETKSSKKTFKELTSVYCLTTDPDRSVSKDYMEAAGQNGIPTCFIVGKTGEIEWIGHPMSMDESLAKIVDGSWDRVAYLVDFKKSQDRDLLESAIMKKVRSGDSDGAMALIDKAKKDAEGDTETVEMLDQMSLNIAISPIMAKVRSGDIDGGLEMLDEVAKTLPPSQRTELSSFKVRLLIQNKNFKSAASNLKSIVDADSIDPQILNMHAWDVYEAAKDDPEYSKELLSVAISAAEKAASSAPENGAVLDTLAHLFHRSGDLDRAIELQTKAMELSDDAAPQIQEFLDQLKAEKTGK